MNLGFCLRLNPLQHTECPEGQRDLERYKMNVDFQAGHQLFSFARKAF